MSELYELVCKVKGVEPNEVVFLFYIYIFLFFFFFFFFSFVVNLTPDSLVLHFIGCKLH
jgi:hypothetical protein